MKKIFIGIAVTLIMIIGVVVLLTSETISNNDSLQSSLILIVAVGFSILILVKRIISFRKGEATDDELSKLILQKSSSLAFYVSLYLWLIISYFSSKINIEAEELIGYGIIGMAIIFAGIWSFLKIKGLQND